MKKTKIKLWTGSIWEEVFPETDARLVHLNHKSGDNLDSWATGVDLNLTELFDKNNAQDDTIQEVKDLAEEAKDLALGSAASKVFDNYTSMCFNLQNNIAYTSNPLKVGTHLLIIQLNVPDLWVSYVLPDEFAEVYDYTDDAAFLEELNTNGHVIIGKYWVSALETQKVNLPEYVKFTDYASGTKAGVLIINNYGFHGVSMIDNGTRLAIAKATNSEIDAKSSGFKPIVPSSLDYAVKVGISTNTETLTDEEKASACEWLGAVYQDSKKAVAIGSNNSANNREAFAHGFGNMVNGNFAYGSGFSNVSHADISHTEGQGNVVGDLAQVEVRDTGEGGHAEGFGNLVLGKYAHAGGANNIAKGDFSKSDGIGGNDWAHPENSEVALSYFDEVNYIKNTTIGHGVSYTANNDLTYFSEGRFGAGTQSFSNFTARLRTGDYVKVIHSNGAFEKLVVHSVGAGYFYVIGQVAWLSGDTYIIVEAHQADKDVVSGTSAGVGSHVSGFHNYALYDYQTVIGKYNENKYDTLFEVGNGTDNDHRGNAFEVCKNNTAKINGRYVATQDYVYNGFVARNTVASNIVYGKEGGVEKVYDVGTAANPNYVVKRDAGGAIFVPQTPGTGTHAASKAYVDNHFTGLYKHNITVTPVSCGPNDKLLSLTIISTQSEAYTTINESLLDKSIAVRVLIQMDRGDSDPLICNNTIRGYTYYGIELHGVSSATQASIGYAYITVLEDSVTKL